MYYRIEDSIHYKFDFVGGLRARCKAAPGQRFDLRGTLRFNVDDILTSEIARFQETVRARAAKLIDAHNLGIVIEHCEVQSKPPRQLKMAFDAVLTAVSARDKMLNDALSDQNRTTNRAAADATGLINAARAQGIALVDAVAAEATNFTDLLPRYRANPELVENILLAETFGHVLTNAQEKWYLPEHADGKPWEIRLQLSREPQAPKQSVAVPSSH